MVAAADQPRPQARILEAAGDIAQARSDHDQARTRYETALLLYQQIGDVLGEFVDSDGCDRHAVLVVLDFLRNADLHVLLLDVTAEM